LTPLSYLLRVLSIPSAVFLAIEGVQCEFASGSIGMVNLARARLIHNSRLRKVAVTFGRRSSRRRVL
jgi:hypothetical protein